MQYKASIFNNIIEQTQTNSLLYNALSGEFVRLNMENFNFIQDIKIPKNADNVNFDYFVKKGFIVPETKNEVAFITDRKNSLQFSDYDRNRSYVIATTTRCNYQCVYCFEQGQLYCDMSIETAKQVAEYITQHIKKNPMLSTLRITWFGGEPLLKTDCISTITAIIRDTCLSKNIKYSAGIITNGLLLTPDITNFLIGEGVDTIQVTLDGEEDVFVHYKKAQTQDLETIISNLEYACTKANVNIRLNASADNMNSLLSLTRRLARRPKILMYSNIYVAQIITQVETVRPLSNSSFSKFKLKFIRCLMDIGWKDQLEIIFPQPRFISCGFLKKNNFAIDPNGYLYKCEHYIGNQQMAVGDIWEGRYYNQADLLFAQYKLPAKCNLCSIYPICMGGCIQKRLENINTVDCRSKKREIFTMLREIYKKKSTNNELT